MNRLRIDFLVAALLCAAIGLLAGRLSVSAGGHGHSHAPPAASRSEAAPALSPATLANLGVEVAEVVKGDFVLATPVAATVVAPPRAERPLVAPLGGRVRTVHVELGERVEPGTPLVTLVREALPLPQLTLTAEVLRPGREALHEAVVELHRAAQELEIARTERDRVAPFTRAGQDGLPVLPVSESIQLEYAARRAEQAYERAVLELHKHGLSDAQVAEIEAGEHLPPLDDDKWRRALERNGLWPPAAQALFAALPEQLRRLPWVAATIGELAARGLASPELEAWLAEDLEAARQFLSIGVLLQRGHSLADLRELHALGALEPVVTLRAPAAHTADGAWDVMAIHVREGAEVAAGVPLVGLTDHGRMLLRVEPLGREVATLLAAARSGRPLTARPLVPGTGPELVDLTLGIVHGDPNSGGTLALIEVENTVLAETRGEEGRRPTRTFALREGLEYVVEIPERVLEDVIVLPAEAVTEQGADTVVFVEIETGFAPAAIVVAHRDERVVVVDPRTSPEPHPGDRIAVRGAFALGLALASGDSAVAPHHH